MNTSDKTIKALATSLNMRELRQKIIASNIANSDTPGYKAKRLAFEAALARAVNLDQKNGMYVENPHHYDVGGGGFKNLKPEIYKDPNGVISQDGNTVDRDAEIAKLNENNILYEASIQLLNKKLGLRKYIANSER